MLLWIGQALSALGSRVSLVAYPLLVLATTHSPSKAGLVGFAQAVPVTVLALPAGVLADRVNRRLLMIACDGARALALACIPVALAAGSLPYGLILGVALVDGAGFVFTYVAERGALRNLVAPEQLGEAVARNESRMFGAALVGPPLGGALFGLARALPFIGDAVSYAVSVATKLAIGSDLRGERTGLEPAGAREGLRWLWQRPFFRDCSLLFACSNPIFTGLELLIIVLARRHGASAALVGAMLGVSAVGGLIGTLLAPRLARRVSARAALIAETWTLAVTLPLLALAHNALLLGAIIGAAELFTPTTNAIVSGLRVALAPDALQGRVQAASTVVSFAAGWLGPLGVGLLLTGAGSTATVLVLTGWALVLALAVLVVGAFRHAPAFPGHTPQP